MGKNRYFIKLAYNGAAYNGWQVQKNAPSVQGTIADALQMLLSTSVSLTGCGRTDAGVHATEFYAHFEMTGYLSQQELDQLVFRLNRFLPDKIVIFRIWQVPGDLHARFSAISRTYLYRIHNRKDPFLEGLSWFFPAVLDLDRMNQAAEILFEYQDFTTFSKLHTNTGSNLCTIKGASWEAQGHQIAFRIAADRFLRNMVRAIVGTMIEVGTNKMDLEGFRKSIEGRSRSLAGQSVPGHGLYLVKVEYPDPLIFAV